MSFSSKTYTCGDTGGVRKLVNLTGPWIDVSLPANGIPDGSKSLLLDIEVDPNNGDKVFTVGEGYCSSLATNWYGIAVTSNGGALWTVPAGNYQNIVNNVGCYHKWLKVDVVDSNTIFVCGIVDPVTRKGTVAKSLDGGATFNMCGPLPTLVDNMDCNSIHFIDANNGIVGLDDYICKTTDGGATWTVLNGGNSFTSDGFAVGPITGIHLSADQQTILAAGLPRVVRSITGGILASSFFSPVVANNNSFYHLSAFSNTEIFVSGLKDTIIFTPDGGSSWNACPYALPGGLPSSGPSRIAAHYYKLNGIKYEGFYSGNANIYNTLNSHCVSPLPPVSETSPYGIQAVWTWYQEGPPPTCYLLTECNTGASIITNTDLSAYVGGVVAISGVQGCWQVATTIDCSGAVGVTITTSYGDCQSCYPSCFLLSDCSGGSNPITILTNTDLSQYLGLVVQLSNYPGVCWSVTKSPTCAGATPLNSSITAEYSDCASCTQKCYKLIDCTGKNPDVVTNTDLSNFIGKIIKIKGCPDTCWTVLASDTCTGASPITFDSYYNNCNTCLDIIIPDIVLKTRSLYPNYGNSQGGCSIEYIEKVNCNFVDQIYQKLIVKRYGVQSCEDDSNYSKYLIKKWLLDLDLVRDPMVCSTGTCCAPCSVSASITVSNAVSCPLPSNVTATITVLPVPCEAPSSVVSTISF